uniref:Peptidase A1 domain-containing protein n=1 Tax=Ananas comosus var. bracteatus TaxID=296719 RepID=A0A6V7NXS2_ANACO|nr:unnamed protein product [Ananas comosus var. bracteatus]
MASSTIPSASSSSAEPRRRPIATAARIDSLRAVTRTNELRQGGDGAAAEGVRGPRPAPSGGGSLAARVGVRDAAELEGVHGMGKYFVRFHIGTPVQRFVLVTDTRSDLT